MPSHLLRIPGFALAAQAMLGTGRYACAILFLSAFAESPAGFRQGSHVRVCHRVIANGPPGLDKGMLRAALLLVCGVAGVAMAIPSRSRLRRLSPGCATLYLPGALVATGGAAMERRLQKHLPAAAAAAQDQGLAAGFDGAKPG